MTALTSSETCAPEGRERAKERPIIFSAPMVRAILAGRKTQTRRVLKLPPKQFERPDMGGWEPCTNGGGGCFRLGRGGERIPAPETVGIWHRTTGWCQDAPHQVGDRLWVRETWARLGDLTHNDPGVRALAEGCFYRADEGTVDGEIPRWRSPIFMPRALSRLTLEVTEVRVERLHDISHEDAIAEGCLVVRDACNVFEDTGYHKAGLCHSSPVTAFGIAWDEIHGADAFEANPWVAAITFKPLSLSRQNEGVGR